MDNLRAGARDALAFMGPPYRYKHRTPSLVSMATSTAINRYAHTMDCYSDHGGEESSRLVDRVCSGPAGLWQQSIRELFGVEFVDGVVDSSPVGEIDASVGEGGGDLFGGAPTALVVEGFVKGG